MKKAKTNEIYIQQVALINPNIEVLEKYINANTKILHRCKIDNHKWYVAPDKILRGYGCPVCGKRTIGNAPEYINSIWASEYKEYFSQYMTEDQMKKYTPQSNASTYVLCPYCGNNKKIMISNLFKRGLKCICEDGYSYPNKFIYKMLELLDIDYITEKIFEWSDGRKYDIYIPSKKCIIENHGEQHYNGSFSKYGGRTLEEEQKNDNYKKQLALNNNILYYFELDCRESNAEWIKKSIESTGLLDVICAADRYIDWNKCDEFASSNLVKTISDLWNEGLSVKQIIKKTQTSYQTVERYLSKAMVLGLCNNYSTEEACNRGVISRTGKNNHMSRTVVRLMDGKIYDTLSECAKDNDWSRSTIANRCKKHKEFMFYEEYMAQHLLS